MDYYLYKEDENSILGPCSFSEIEEVGRSSEGFLVCGESGGYPDGHWRPIQDAFGSSGESFFEADPFLGNLTLGHSTLAGETEELSWVTPFLKGGKRKDKEDILFPLIDRYLKSTSLSFKSPPPAPRGLVDQNLSSGTDPKPELPPIRESLVNDELMSVLRHLQKRLDASELIQKNAVPHFPAPILPEKPAFPRAEVSVPVKPRAPAPPFVQEFLVEANIPLKIEPQVLSESALDNPLADALKLEDAPSDRAVEIHETEKVAESFSSENGLHIQMGDSFSPVSETIEESGKIHMSVGEPLEVLPEQMENLEAETLEMDKAPSSEESPISNAVSEDLSATEIDQKPVELEVPSTSLLAENSGPAMSAIPSDIMIETGTSAAPEIVIESPLQTVEGNVDNAAVSPSSGIGMEPVITPLFDAPAQPAFSTEAAPSFATETFMDPLGSSPMGGIGQPSPFQVPSASQDILERFAKPELASISTPLKKEKASSSRLKSIFVLVVGVAILAGVFFFLFSSAPKDLGNMLNIGADQKRLGMGVARPSSRISQAGTPMPSPALNGGNPSSMTQNETSQTNLTGTGESSVPSSPAPRPEPLSHPAPVIKAHKKATPDDQAIELVKEYPLEGSKGNVGKWLNYAFAADSDTREEWSSGKIDRSAYLVRYRVTQNSKYKRREITYLFEADVAGGLVLGDNAVARQLLAGEGSIPKPKRRRKISHKKY